MTTGTCTGYTKSNKQGIAMWRNSLSIPFSLNLCLNINQSNLKCTNSKYPRKSHEMPAELYSTVQWWDIYWTTQVQWSTNNYTVYLRIWTQIFLKRRLFLNTSDVTVTHCSSTVFPNFKQTYSNPQSVKTAHWKWNYSGWRENNIPTLMPAW